ncbi:MAG: carbohydrate binding domain-containing protein, partial [bacterium]|nr:carbohydrate binding domain-containing protein [bacterium]
MRPLILAVLSISCLFLGRIVQAQSDLFPFVVPWDVAPSGVADMSSLLHRPAGKFGHVRVGADGHFYVGTQRIRFWGVNFSADACFLYKANAPKVALRLAKAGVNIVRFHHMDAPWANPSLILYASGNSRQFNTQALDNLDYLFAQLKRVGIYANINLLVHRRFLASDGLPAEIESLADQKDQHVIGFFYQPLIELQKEYARQLLTHRNPYTGLTYARDPAVAFVEINNENGLVQGFMGGVTDRIPAVFQADLQRQWNEWLLAKYGDTANLRQAWGERNEPLGPEMVTNGSYTNGTTGWYLEQHQGAQASATVVSDAPSGYTRSVRIQVTRTGSQGWHVQWAQPGLTVVGDGIYTLSFWAKASSTR